MTNLKDMSYDELRNLIEEATKELNSRPTPSFDKITVNIELNTSHKCWAKIVKRVDKTQSNGFAFIGDFIKANEMIEIPNGVYVLAYEENGSKSLRRSEAKILRATDDGLIETGISVSTTKGDWALQIRDKAAEIINK